MTSHSKSIATVTAVALGNEKKSNSLVNKFKKQHLQYNFNSVLWLCTPEKIIFSPSRTDVTFYFQSGSRCSI